MNTSKITKSYKQLPKKNQYNTVQDLNNMVSDNLIITPFRYNYTNKIYIKKNNGQNCNEYTKEIIDNNGNVEIKITKNGKIISNYHSKCNDKLCKSNNGYHLVKK